MTPQFEKRLVFTGRVTMIILMIAVVGYAGWSIKLLLDSFETAPRPETTTAPGELPAAAVVQAGDWALSGVGGTLKMEMHLPTELAAYFEAPPENVSLSPTASPMEELILRWTTSAGTRQSSGRRDYIRRESQTENRRTCVFVRPENQVERVVLGRLAIREGGVWRCIEWRNGPIAASSGGDANHLVPVPDGATTLAVRRNAAQALQCEVISVRGNVPQILEDWRRLGWSVERLETDFHADNQYFCRRESRLVHASFIYPTNNSADLLMLLSAADH